MRRSICTYLEINDAKLFTSITLPAQEGKFPTVIMRSPYVDASENLTEEEICLRKPEQYKLWLDNGYAVVFQHCRGSGKSTGDLIPFLNEKEDGLHLQDWIRQQPFYNGELYLWGASYTTFVHYVTAPFADDIKAAVLQIADTELYNTYFRNGFYKMSLHGRWHTKMYKKKSIRSKSYTNESFSMLPLSAFSQTVFGEPAEHYNEVLRHPRKEDAFWKTRYGSGETRDALKNANIPILLVTGFYDIYTGGIFDMWNTLDENTKSRSALVVHPFDHDFTGENQPIRFENGDIHQEFENYSIAWLNASRDHAQFPFETGKVTYYKLFDRTWCCDDFAPAKQYRKYPLGKDSVSYQYDPRNPATFKGGLSTNSEGTAWQDTPFARNDIITVYTPAFEDDTFIKGKFKAKLTVRSDCEDTCFYMRISLCKAEGDYGLRDDINQISNFDEHYVPGSEIEMDFSFDEHAFVIHRGEKLRIDISSSAFPYYVSHTNNKGLFSEQTQAKIANNTILLERSHIEIPIG